MKQTCRGETCASCASASWLRLRARRQYCSKGPIACLRERRLASRTDAIPTLWPLVTRLLPHDVVMERSPQRKKIGANIGAVVLLLHARRHNVHERRPVPFGDSEAVVDRRHRPAGGAGRSTRFL